MTSKKTDLPAGKPIVVHQHHIVSDFLQRTVIADVYQPAGFSHASPVTLLLVNDGQDLRTMQFEQLLGAELPGLSMQNLLVAGIHCGPDRVQEYGVMYRQDYLGRGWKGGLYQRFVMDELLPHLAKILGVDRFDELAFAGFSMGGLSALDIVWNNANVFTKVGVFSGSLWWRRHGYDHPDYNEHKDRIVHLQVEKGSYKPGLQFFFECGRLDETADRNSNGIIDSIEDTLDLIEKLKALGYTDAQLRYLELQDGRHDVPTWRKAFPEFLKWAWGK